MTDKEMIENIKIMLGYPSISLEIDDDQISAYIKIALNVAKSHMFVKRFKTLNLGRSEGRVIPYYTWHVDLKDLEYEIITNVYRGDMLTPYLYDQGYLVNYATRGVPASLAVAINARSNIEALINRSWKVVNNVLYLDKFYTSVTIEFVPTTITVDDLDDAFWVDWVQSYALALAKEGLARIRGKLLVDSNPFKMDSDTLASEAASDKERLMEKIESKGFLGPVR